MSTNLVRPVDLGELPSPAELGGPTWRHAISSGCAASLATFILALLGLFVALVLDWNLPPQALSWPIIGAGVVFCLVLVRWGVSEARTFNTRQSATEAVWACHRARAEGILSVTGMMVQIAERALQRDLDGDGVIGVPVAPPKRLVPVHGGRQGALMLSNQASLPAPSETPATTGRMIELPGEVLVDEGDLRAFVLQCYERGLSRRQWAGVTLPSGQNVSKDYHAKLLTSLSTLGLVVARGERCAGQLTYGTASEALEALSLQK